MAIKEPWLDRGKKKEMFKKEAAQDFISLLWERPLKYTGNAGGHREIQDMLR